MATILYFLRAEYSIREVQQTICIFITSFLFLSVHLALRLNNFLPDLLKYAIGRYVGDWFVRLRCVRNHNEKNEDNFCYKSKWWMIHKERNSYKTFHTIYELNYYFYFFALKIIFCHYEHENVPSNDSSFTFLWKSMKRWKNYVQR